jgi:hypothetical protein
MTGPRARRWRNRFRGAVTERWPAKITAIALALLLWVVVELQAPAESWVDVRVELAMDSGLVLADTLPRVRALVAGSGRDLIELDASPPVAHMDASDAGSGLAVIAFASSDVELPPGMDARVRDVRPRVVRVRLRASR